MLQTVCQLACSRRPKLTTQHIQAIHQPDKELTFNYVISASAFLGKCFHGCGYLFLCTHANTWSKDIQRGPKMSFICRVCHLKEMIYALVKKISIFLICQKPVCCSWQCIALCIGNNPGYLICHFYLSYSCHRCFVSCHGIQNWSSTSVLHLAQIFMGSY